MAFGAMAFVYAVYALGFAFYFWQSRLLPLVGELWTGHGWWGRALLLLLITAVVVPLVYYLTHYGWSRIQAGLEWMARRDLLVRVDVLALLIGVPLLIGIPVLIVSLWLMALPYSDLMINAVIWFVFLTAMVAMVGIARQLPGSRFQWSVWSLTIAFASLTIAWISRSWFPLVEELGLIVAAGGVLAAGIISWLTIQPDHLELRERLLMATFFLLGMVVLVATLIVGNGRWLTTLFILMGIIPGLIFLTPLLFNFLHSRFLLPWLLLVLAILLFPWLQFFSLLYVPMAILWLYAALLYVLLGTLAQFARIDTASEEEASFSERERLVDAFNHFMQAFFLSYEAVFGRRRLQKIYLEIIAFGPIDPDDDILTLAQKCRRALLHAVDRLDDLAGTPFTQQAGQAAYDSLPWLEAETLGRHVLAELEWGAKLAQGFIYAHDQRRELIRQADIFAGFDEFGIDEVLAVAREWNGRSRVTMARAGEDAQAFYLVESGEIGVFHEGQQVATIAAGGYIGTLALLDEGEYLATYKTLSPVKALVIDRARFDPLLRVDTTLSSQVSSGAKSRHLLKQMPLFNSLSPQQIAVIDAQLVSKHVKAGEILVRLGDPRSNLFIVANGRLEVLNQSDQLIGTLNTGEHFGEYALFADVAYTATLRAAEDSELLLLAEPTFDNLVAEYERMSHYVEQIGSGRLLAGRRKMGVTAVIS
jgi:CRP-like cAMP-binding protein